jgi:hypothetical protein
VGQCAMTYSVAARPLITGSIMSMVITSGRNSRHRAIASFPSLASPTTSMRSSAFSTAQRRARTVAESSTTSTRVTAMSRDREGANVFEEHFLVEVSLGDVRARSGVEPALPILGRRA